MWPSDASRSSRLAAIAASLPGWRNVVTWRGRRERGAPAVIAAFRGTSGWAEFAREMDRSRRHERPLAVGSLVLDGSNGPVRGEEAAAGAASAVRTLDLVWADGHHVFLAMPETGRDGAVLVLTRVARLITPHAPDNWRLAIFPEDAWTAEGLIERLRSGAGPPRSLLSEPAS